MQFSVILAAALNLAGAAFALPAPVTYAAYAVTPTSTITSSASCTTTVTVTETYPVNGTTTVYNQMAAVPLEILCNGCDLKVETTTVGKPATATATVTADFTLIRIPLCTELPVAPTDA
ncbi:hypothetical protein Dda_5009 [Drechslerella dactyloides]|uniref:Uncharacterized protein n=1 Tax=Drechslerella dactyloides TaxID=74499 RepID=A0AAD6IXY3_DREDA|nr:hypothetical protein Dda_5009 [Drechslerella dactyloides]